MLLIFPSATVLRGLQYNGRHEQKAARIGIKSGVIRNKWLHGGSKGGNAINLCRYSPIERSA